MAAVDLEAAHRQFAGAFDHVLPGSVDPSEPIGSSVSTGSLESISTILSSLETALLRLPEADLLKKCDHISAWIDKVRARSSKNLASSFSPQSTEASGGTTATKGLERQKSAVSTASARSTPSNLAKAFSAYTSTSPLAFHVKLVCEDVEVPPDVLLSFKSPRISAFLQGSCAQWIIIFTAILVMLLYVCTPGSVEIPGPSSDIKLRRHHPFTMVMHITGIAVILTYNACHHNRCLFFQCLRKFDFWMLVVPSTVALSLKVFEVFRLADEVSELTSAWVVLEISRVSFCSVPILVYLGSLDAANFSRMFKGSLLIILLAALISNYLQTRFLSKEWSDNDICVGFVECGPPRLHYLSCIVVSLLFVFKMLFHLCRGRDLVVVRPYYTFQPPPLSPATFSTQS